MCPRRAAVAGGCQQERASAGDRAGRWGCRGFGGESAHHQGLSQGAPACYRITDPRLSPHGAVILSDPGRAARLVSSEAQTAPDDPGHRRSPNDTTDRRSTQPPNPDHPIQPPATTSSGHILTETQTMFAKSFKTLVLATLIGATALPALATGGHSVVVQQNGWNNQVGGGQSGHRQRLTVIQNGGSNIAVATQDGRRNDAAIGQSGWNNTATTDQWGRRNTVGVAQMGNNNAADVGQYGRNNVAAVVQLGDNNSASATQTGVGNVIAIVQH
ncbi:hypothetical protein DDE23_24800 [Pararhodobacter aggregans]|uniref:Curlin-associated protein n=2 Tax=Paracoccaceae TaxID=31989 RepID=A0A2T7UJC4_9RHOB|nr:hypothetical protein DDE23_24800 [Pararhodobacter aggregans]